MEEVHPEEEEWEGEEWEGEEEIKDDLLGEEEKEIP